MSLSSTHGICQNTPLQSHTSYLDICRYCSPLKNPINVQIYHSLITARNYHFVIIPLNTESDKLHEFTFPFDPLYSWSDGKRWKAAKLKERSIRILKTMFESRATVNVFGNREGTVHFVGFTVYLLVLHPAL